MIQAALDAVRAGLAGQPLPNVGLLDKQAMLLVNTLYEEARNWQREPSAPIKR